MNRSLPMDDHHALDPAVDGLLEAILSLRTKPPIRSKDPERYLRHIWGEFHRFPDHFLYVLNYTEGRVVYAQGFQEVLGIPDGEVDLELIFSLWHPEDAPVMARLNKAVIKAMATIRNPSGLYALTLTVDSRMRKADGTYIKVLRQTSCFEVDEASGRVISSVSLCKDISAIKQQPTIGWQIRSMDDVKIDLRELTDHMARIQYSPSARERDVLKELALGRNSKAIAEALGISLHTVNAHRRNLLQRTGKANTAQLMRHASQQGWV